MNSLHTFKDKIRNEDIMKGFEVANVEDKIKECFWACVMTAEKKHSMKGGRLEPWRFQLKKRET